MNPGIRDKVREILKDDPKSRDSDKYLVWQYGIRFHNINKNTDGPSWILNPAFPEFESLTRARRHIQSKEISLRGNRYIARKEREVEVREYYSGE